MNQEQTYNFLLLLPLQLKRPLTICVALDEKSINKFLTRAIQDCLKIELECYLSEKNCLSEEIAYHYRILEEDTHK